MSDNYESHLVNFTHQRTDELGIEELEERDDEVLPDGSDYSDLHNVKRTSKVYYWLDPEIGSALGTYWCER